ncbi:MAG: AIR carboxylase family protein, partial [Deltaproteobacteria bacterium]|nr:AIR carboxylase family protein [Deltaproteobacteria bacterium]
CAARTRGLVQTAEAAGVQVFLCAAGMAAHLAGTVAAETTKPVIGIPVDASPLGGLDALLSTVQMPPGVPVATVAVGKAGARNAAVLACQILALGDAGLAGRLKELKEEMARGVEAKDAALQASLRQG